jgi:hypothetical protein
MLIIALELAQEDPAYEELAMKFVEHFFWIAGAMDRLGENADELWDEEDGFFYDVLHLPEHKLRCILGRMLDEDRFFSKYGVRALSRGHLDHPYEFDAHGVLRIFPRRQR